MSIAEIKKMTTAERLQAMENLWEALCEDEGNLESPAWHEKILEERRRRIESGEATFYTLDQLKERLRG